MSSSPVSEMNKPEAERCVDIALTARAAGDLAKAERFLLKSISMFPTPRAQSLLVQVQTQQTTSSSTSTSSPTSSTYTYQSTTTSTSTTFQTAPPAPPKPSFTPEQRDAARAVIRQSNFYSILNLPLPTSPTPPTDADIKAAYRRMALKFHPDKNHAPEAEEAFKKVSAAFQCLSDERKKAQYDASGFDEGVGRGVTGARGGGGAGPAYYSREEDVSPEDIFNMFFGGGGMRGAGMYNMNGQRVFTRRRYAPQQQQQGGGGGAGQAGGQSASLMQFVHFLPLLLLFLFSFLSAPSSDDALPFALSSSPSFTQHRKTLHSSLPYFVQPSFTYRYARDKRALTEVEGLVEQEWLKRWRAECDKEKRELSKMEQAMKSKRGEELNRYMAQVEQFKEDRMHNCDRLAQGLKG